MEPHGRQDLVLQAPADDVAVPAHAQRVEVERHGGGRSLGLGVAAGRRIEAHPFAVHGRLDPGVRVEEARSEEHTSELQSLTNLVCRLLLEKKKGNTRPRSCHWSHFLRAAARALRAS